MSSIRDKTCGECDHSRPLSTEEVICGNVPPRAEIYGTITEKNGAIRPLLTTIRPIMAIDEPCCADFIPITNETIPAPAPIRKRANICIEPGCVCKKEEGSDYCADHEPEDAEIPEDPCPEA